MSFCRWLFKFFCRFRSSSSCRPRSFSSRFTASAFLALFFCRSSLSFSITFWVSHKVNICNRSSLIVFVNFHQSLFCCSVLVDILLFVDPAVFAEINSGIRAQHQSNDLYGGHCATYWMNIVKLIIFKKIVMSWIARIWYCWLSTTVQWVPYFKHMLSISWWRLIFITMMVECLYTLCAATKRSCDPD